MDFDVNESWWQIEREKGATKRPFTDTHGRVHNYLRISLTEKCNLRCLYCMPEEGVTLSPSKNLLTSDEIVKLVQIFASHGVDKIRLTGGEPSIREDIVELVERIRNVPGIKDIGLTSNGIILTKKLRQLKDAGLTKVNISLDTLDPRKFMLMTRRNGFAKVMKCIDHAETLFPKVKPILLTSYPSTADKSQINTVVMRSINDDEVNDFVDLTKDRRLDVRFIEYMPFGGNHFSTKKFIDYKTLLVTINEKYNGLVQRLQDAPNDTTKAFKISGFVGQFGFITSMSDNFCGTCNRLRITADGNLKVCLHGTAEVSMRELLRSGASSEEISDVIQKAVARKKKQHAAADINNRLSHVSKDGSAKQVDISHKPVSHREAVAEGKVLLTPELVHQIKHNLSKKGDVLNVARVASVMGAKLTANIIPLCHNIPISYVNTDFRLDEVAALTVYDMCKAVTQKMVISEIRLVSKTGGKTEYKAVSDF
ncbi:molybdenum cofactor biosynthesis protein A [Ancylostoma duodenale]|uniref:GTP 3',8-cyclase n=1 Tax=Ancylostoma duodenale TaxID=51022 RepID=A0A0C2CBN6_9BILA|nr:molybdenum cofactor biosynthesis protein A [Ancylostoma duodenale]